MAMKKLTKSFSADLMNAIDALIVVMNPQGKIVFCNKACEELTGFKLADIESKGLFDIFILPEEVEVVKAVFADLVVHQENSKHTNHWRTASGGKRLISWSNTCLKDPKGKLDYIVGTGVDITDWKKDKRTLKERETKLQALFIAAPDSIVVIDGKGIIEETNPAIEHTFGYKPEDIIGKSVTLLMPEPYKSEHNGYLANYHRTHEAKVIGTGREIEALHKDGHIFPIYLSISESSYNGNNHFTGIIRDITIPKLQEEKLRRAHKAEAIGQLTGGIAHDFNNLLTIILGNLEVLEGDPLNPEARDILQEVYDAIEQGSDLVSQLLAFGRRQSLSPKTVDICKIVKHLTHFLRRTLPENIEIVTQLEHDLWQCHADPGQIENALLNVVLNARDAMPNGGKITIKTAHVTFASYDMPNDIGVPCGDYCGLSISDTGHGMSAHVLERATDPFFTTKSVGIGTGLGLSMVHGFVEQSSGSMHIESQEGVGTTVSLYLPRSEEKIPATAYQDATPIHPLIKRGQKILHVEDDARVRQINTRRLSSMGFQVLTAKDAPTALDILSKHNDIEVVFSDIVMPGGMTGIELAKKLQSLNPAIKVLLTTGYSKEILSADNYNINVIKKPFSKRELQTKLQEVLAD